VPQILVETAAPEPTRCLNCEGGTARNRLAMRRFMNRPDRRHRRMQGSIKRIHCGVRPCGRSRLNGWVAEYRSIAGGAVRSDDTLVLVGLIDDPTGRQSNCTCWLRCVARMAWLSVGRLGRRTEIFWIAADAVAGSIGSDRGALRIAG
jgi:hypothetical protein